MPEFYPYWLLPAAAARALSWDAEKFEYAPPAAVEERDDDFIPSRRLSPPPPKPIVRYKTSDYRPKTVSAPPGLDDQVEEANAIPSDMVAKAYAPSEAYVTVDRSDDRRVYSPVGSDRWPSTLYGSAAQLQNKMSQKVVSSALPCIDRHVRREVMFARKKAGRGYRRPRRRSWASWIRC